MAQPRIIKAIKRNTIGRGSKIDKIVIRFEETVGVSHTKYAKPIQILMPTN